ncbi:MAG: hypothetical protein FWF09_06490, partial [Bacteroidales bacterium]|nr:hypothetical protein [Bacteroidales bacterium]
MNHKKFTLFLICALLLQVVSFKTVAQCSTAYITATEKQGITCFNEGVIEITIHNPAGLILNDPVGYPLHYDLIDATIGTPITIDGTLSGTTNIREISGIYEGKYTVVIKAFCLDGGNYHAVNMTLSLPIEFANHYKPFSFMPAAKRQSLSCMPTGQIAFNFSEDGGNPPYTVELMNYTPSAGQSYTGTTIWTGVTPGYVIDDMPPGTYNFKASDNCTNQTMMVYLPSVPNDFDLMWFRADMAYQTNSVPPLGDCKSIQLSNNTSNSLNQDQRWYYDNEYYEYAFLVDKIGTKVWKSIERADNSFSPFYELPFNSYAEYCATGPHTIDFYMRIKGCSNEIETTYFNTFVCPSLTGGEIFWGHTYSDWSAGDDCALAKTWLRMNTSYALCYPVTYSIVETASGNPFLSGTVDGNTVPSISNYGNYDITTADAGGMNWKRGVSYTITLTESGVAPPARTFTYTFTVPTDEGQQFAASYYTSTGGTSCSQTFAFIHVQGWVPFEPGTIIEYVSGPMPLPSMNYGDTYIIPNDFNSSQFVYNVSDGNFKNAWDNIVGFCPDFAPGTYRFDITNNCGKTHTVTQNISTFMSEPFDYTRKPVCGGIEITPTNRFAQCDYFSGSTIYPQSNSSGTFYSVIGTPPGVVIPSTNYPYPHSFVFGVPGTYTIRMTNSLASEADCATGDVVLTERDFLYVDKDAISRYICEGETYGQIFVQAEGGVSPYKYEIYAPRNPMYHPGADGVTWDYAWNFTGEFPHTGIYGDTYHLIVTDDCGFSLAPIEITMIDLENTSIVYAPKTAFCPGEQVQLNSIALGNGVSYLWGGPNAWSWNGMRPRFIATDQAIDNPPAPYPIPDYGNYGTYWVDVWPVNCAAAKHEEISITIGGFTIEPFEGEIEGDASICLGTTTSQRYRVKLIDGIDPETGYEWSFSPAGVWNIFNKGFVDNYAYIDATQSTMTGGIYTLTVTASKTACGATETQTLTKTIRIIPGVPPNPPGPIELPLDVCGTKPGTTFIAKIPPIADVTYTWTATDMMSNPLTFTGQGTEEIEIVIPATLSFFYIITVKVEGECGNNETSGYVMVNMSTSPNLTAPIVGPATACAGSSDWLQYVTTAVSVTFDWGVPDGWTIEDAGETTDPPLRWIWVTAGETAESGYIEVWATNSCNDGDPVKFWVDVETSVVNLTGNLTGDDAVCATATDPYRYSFTGNSAAHNYTWTFPAGWLASEPTATTATTTDLYIDLVPTVGSGTKTISVVANNSCGAGAALNLSITVYDEVPEIPANAISGDPVVCRNTEATFSIVAMSDVAEYTWEIDDDVNW